MNPALHQSTPAELKERLALERTGLPFLQLRDGQGRQVLVPLERGRERLTLGRAASCDVRLDWDSEVSRLHTELVPVGGDWTVVDDGLSRNGTFLNGQRLQGRRRLAHGDELRLGGVVVCFNAPAQPAASETALAGDEPGGASLTETQRKVLVALCRPFRDEQAYATPATNRAIAEELYLTVDAVKKHLRTLFAKFGIDDVPQNRKRAALVERALQTGAVSRRDL